MLPLAERSLHQPILARMITDHGKRSAGPERVTEGGQGAGESAEFVVDGDPDGLEDPGEIAGAAAGLRGRREWR